MILMKIFKSTHRDQNGIENRQFVVNMNAHRVAVTKKSLIIFLYRNPGKPYFVVLSTDAVKNFHLCKATNINTLRAENIMIIRVIS